MALNLIKVRPAESAGLVWIGVTQIAMVEQTQTGATITLTNGQKLNVIDQAQSIAEWANRRPPDGQ